MNILQAEEIVKGKRYPKSTVSACLIPINNLERAGSNRNYPEKATKEDPRRVL
jgi:hypothetical protein